MSNQIDPTNISLLAFMRLSRKEDIKSEELDDLVSRLGVQALNELKILSRVERARLGFDLRRFQPIASPLSSLWLNEMLTSEETIHVEGAAEVQRKVYEELKAEFEAGLQKWHNAEESKDKLKAVQKIRNAYVSISNNTSLHLCHLRLKTLPPEIGQLVNLTALYLDHNQLKEGPAFLGQLTNLRWLHLFENQLEKVPASLGQLANLEWLYLSNNQLKEVPASLGQLTNLIALDLSHNQLKEVPAPLEQLTNLRRLHLSGNQLKEVPAPLCQLTNLRELYLDGNQIKEVPASLGQLFSLEKLQIHDNPELSDLPLSLGHLPRLTYLDRVGTLIPFETRDAILVSCKVARERESHKKLPQTLNLWKTKAVSQADFTFLTKDPILSAEKLGGHKVVTRREASGPIKNNYLRVRMDSLLYDFTLDEISALWGIEKGLILSKLQDGTYLEEGSYSKHQQAVLYEWLVRLSRTSDYSHSQRALAERVCQVLEALKEDHEFRERFFIIADSNNERCGDRAAMSLNDIYTAFLLTNLPENASTLEKLKLLVGLAKTYTLRKTLSQLMENQSGLEESVEIFLAKETALKERLCLVTAVETMLYERIGQREWIDDEALVQAVNANYFDQLFDFKQLKELMQKDPEYKSQENELTEDFDIQMGEIEEKKEKLSDEDYRLQGKKLVDEKTKALKGLAREWVERVLASLQEII